MLKEVNEIRPSLETRAVHDEYHSCCQHDQRIVAIVSNCRSEVVGYCQTIAQVYGRNDKLAKHKNRLLKPNSQGGQLFM